MLSENAPQTWQQTLPLEQLQALLDGETSEVRTRPQPGDWGYYLNLGPELGYFSWFASQSEMLRYLVHVEILHAPTSLDDRATYEAIVARLQPTAATYADHGDSPAACAAFNSCFPDFRLEWLGSYAQLLAGDDAFAARLLAAYAESIDPNAPVYDLEQAKQHALPADADALASFIENYGL
ncbi:MAG: hypothetical protein ACAI44_28425 [Candidatus Sericytochromatia bacterium]